MTQAQPNVPPSIKDASSLPFFGNLVLVLGHAFLLLWLIPGSVFRNYSWQVSEDHTGCQGQNLGWLHARKIPYHCTLSQSPIHFLLIYTKKMQAWGWGLNLEQHRDRDPESAVIYYDEHLDVSWDDAHAVVCRKHNKTLYCLLRLSV